MTNDIDNIAPDPAADAEPAAHVRADGDRRADDDVRDLAAAGADRARHDPAVDGRHRARSRKRSQEQFVAQWAHTGALNGQIEETFTGHALVKVFGRQQEVEATFRGEERGAVRRRASARSSSPGSSCRR